MPAPTYGDGVDLTSAMVGGVVPATCDTLYLETFMTQFQHDWSPLQGVRIGGWKWIKAPRPELYDLTADPGQRINIFNAPEGKKELPALKEMLSALRAGEKL